ncbi:HPF/RaiA family ribosome-associated protein [Chlamydia sp. 17-3921]|nr:HPF/RaiA family ribosome-associated protein [Chlamydia sp. 17-3921]
MKPQKGSKSSKKIIKTHNSQTQVEITSKSFHISEPLRQLILEKSKHFPTSESFRVVLTSHKDKQGTEVHVVISIGKKTLQTKALHTNAYTAVINAFKKIRTIMNKLHVKQKDKTKHCHPLSEEEILLVEKEQKSKTLANEWLPFSSMDSQDSLKKASVMFLRQKEKRSPRKNSDS